jgi:hypothetical protein
MPANGIGRFLIARNSLMHSREIQANDRPHVLILPSEEYIPARAPLAGIFQQHQIDAIRPLGEFNFGVISNRLKYSVLMYARAMANAAIIAHQRRDQETVYTAEISHHRGPRISGAARHGALSYASLFACRSLLVGPLRVDGFQTLLRPLRTA